MSGALEGDPSPSADASRDSAIASAFAQAYDDDGVDRSLIRWYLTLTPADRLAYNEGIIELVAAARPSRDGAR